MSTDRHGNHNHQPARQQAAELLWSLGAHINNDPSRRAAYGSPPTAGGAATASGGAYGAPNFTPSTGVPRSASGSQYSSTYGSSPAYSGEFSPLAQRNPFSFGSPSASASRVSLPGSGNTTHPFAGPASPASLLSAGSNSGSASATGRGLRQSSRVCSSVHGRPIPRSERWPWQLPPQIAWFRRWPVIRTLRWDYRIHRRQVRFQRLQPRFCSRTRSTPVHGRQPGSGTCSGSCIGVYAPACARIREHSRNGRHRRSSSLDWCGRSCHDWCQRRSRRRGQGPWGHGSWGLDPWGHGSSSRSRRSTSPATAPSSRRRRRSASTSRTPPSVTLPVNLNGQTFH